MTKTANEAERIGIAELREKLANIAFYFEQDGDAGAASFVRSVSDQHVALLDRIEKLEAGLRSIHAARLREDGSDPGYGWSVTKLNQAMNDALPLLTKENPDARG